MWASIPHWADATGSSKQKDFRSQEVDLDGQAPEILTELGDLYVFELYPNGTRSTPGPDALRVGVAVQVRSDFDHAALEVGVIPWPRWLETVSVSDGDAR